jgi:precorrin-6A/cobalt-precorrin-6A reductase
MTMTVHDERKIRGSFAPRAPVRVLILGGTSEARGLARQIAADSRLQGVISLAGRTASPIEQELPVRIGGFGGAEGLERYLSDESIHCVVDATHPFAAQIAANARAACASLGLPLLKLSRPPWSGIAGDRWVEAADHAAAAKALGASPRRVFLTTGRLGLAHFRSAPQHFYLIRTIDPAALADLPPHCDEIRARGPFDCQSEMELMRAHRIDVVVSKNSGGQLTYAKIEAARRLNLDVVMIARPPVRGVDVVHNLKDAMDFLLGSHAS